MDWNTIIWSVVLFLGSYSSVMATGNPTGVFYWPAVASGFGIVIGYHEGKSQILSTPLNKAKLKYWPTVKAKLFLPK